MEFPRADVMKNFLLSSLLLVFTYSVFGDETQEVELEGGVLIHTHADEQVGNHEVALESQEYQRVDDKAANLPYRHVVRGRWRPIGKEKVNKIEVDRSPRRVRQYPG